MKIFAKLFVLLAVASMASFGAIVIDFSTTVNGGTFTIGNLVGSQYMSTGANIPINNMLYVNGASSTSYAVTGSCGGYGCLNFDTAANTLSITGAVSALGISNSTLLSGSFSSYAYMNSPANVATTGQSMYAMTAVGPDTKSASLLQALGLSTATTFAYAGYTLVTDNIILTTGSTGQIVSSDIRNTATPEPASLALIGLGMLGLAFRKFRRS